MHEHGRKLETTGPGHSHTLLLGSCALQTCMQKAVSDTGAAKRLRLCPPSIKAVRCFSIQGLDSYPFCMVSVKFFLMTLGLFYPNHIIRYALC